MTLPFYKKQLALAVGLAAITCVMPAQAEDAAKSDNAIMLEEIVVTAQKREQNMQDIPVSLTAFNSDKLKQQGIENVSDASQYIPNVMAIQTPGLSSSATIGIRGSVTINPAITWEPTVGMYVDGVFVAKNIGGLFDITELERIEVLRGPQGTLYGKNTIGGAINLITKKPAEEFGGTVRVKAGNYNYSDAYVSVDSGKLGDVVSLNFAVDKQDRDGFYENTVANRKPGVAKRFGDLDSTAARFAALFDIADNLSLYYTYDYSDIDNTPKFGQFDLPGASPSDRHSSGALDGAYFDKSTTQGHAVHIDWDINDSLVFKSITAYRSMDFKDKNDYDGSAFDAFVGYRGYSTDQYSQEFQVVGHSDIADYVAGIYLLKEDTDAKNTFHVLAAPPATYMDINNRYGVTGESVALFGQADWKLTESLTLTTGLRWTREEKEAYIQHANTIIPTDNFAKTQNKDSWQSVTPMVALNYAWSNGVNTYVKVSQGWKSGGFNGEAASIAQFQDSYKPEKVTAYEIGVKSRLFDNRVQANIAYFYNRITDMQVSRLANPPIYSQIFNAGKAVMQGIETELAVQVTENFSVNLAYSYLDAEYKKYNGGPGVNEDNAAFPYAPRHKASAGIAYDKDVSVGILQARLDYSIVGGYSVFDNPANNVATQVKHYSLLNGRIALADMDVGKGQSLEVGLWGKNLLDEKYRVNGLPGQTATGGPAGINYYGDPRTFGADITYKF